mgnify:CR=1 FL=1
MGLDYRPEVLPSFEPLLGGYLLDGYTGTDFLVSLQGLDDPVREGSLSKKQRTLDRPST